MFGSVRNLLLALTLGLLVGSVVGVFVAKRIYTSVPISAVQKLKIEVTTSVDETAKAEVALEEKREEVRTQIKYITKEVVKYVPATENTPDCRLTVGAVGLLNAARTGTDFQPTAYLDAEIKAATSIGMRELSQADIDLASQYRQLAADHDALVDYVEQYKVRLKQIQD